MENGEENVRIHGKAGVCWLFTPKNVVISDYIAFHQAIEKNSSGGSIRFGENTSSLLVCQIVAMFCIQKLPQQVSHLFLHVAVFVLLTNIKTYFDLYCLPTSLIRLSFSLTLSFLGTEIRLSEEYVEQIFTGKILE